MASIGEYKFVKREHIDHVPDGGGLMDVLDNKWWMVFEGHLVFYRGRSPQCNTTKQIVEHLTKDVPFPVTIELIKRVAIPIHIVDQWEDGQFCGIDVRYVFPEEAVMVAREKAQR